MPSSLELSVIVTTFQRPGHLRRCLTSLAAQQGVDGLFEVIVTDDGSQDETAQMVASFARTAPFAVKWTTHPHNGFQVSRSRNAGIRLSVAPYVLFTDGDCIFPLNHLRRHLDARRPGVARAGNCVRLDEATSARIDEEVVRSGKFTSWASPRARLGARVQYGKALFYQTMGHAEKPRFIGWNMATWREHLDRVNGFDERFRGWGCEDDDLSMRLRGAGVRVATSLGYTQGYHLWHPLHPTTPKSWNDGMNVDYYLRPVILPRCLEGIRRRSVAQTSVRVLGSNRHTAFSKAVGAMLHQSARGVEIELLIAPSGERFSMDGSRRILVVNEGDQAPAEMVQMAHATVKMDFARGAGELLVELQQLLTGERRIAAGATARRTAA